jgi:predicted deacylase
MSKSFQHIVPVSYDSGREGPHLLIIAGVHGDEYEPMLAVQRLVDKFSEDLKLENGQMTLVSIVNTPAYERDSRTASDSKDLARTCPGKKDGSETEQIAWEISKLIRSVDFLIDMHTGGKTYEIYPLSGYVLHSDKEILEKQRAMAADFGLPVQWGTSPHLDGRTLSVARDAGVPAIYTEYGGGEQIDPEIVNALYEGCLRVMTSLKMISGQFIQDRQPQYIVEDYREESGHLQIMYPSPIDGRFITSMNLGEMAKKGQLIGCVESLESEEKKEIYANEDGLLFLIRRKTSVKQGEATAGILPITQPGNITLL